MMLGPEGGGALQEMRGLAGRVVKSLGGLLNLSLVITGGANWRVQAGSWFGVWSSKERMGLGLKTLGVST